MDVELIHFERLFNNGSDNEDVCSSTDLALIDGLGSLKWHRFGCGTKSHCAVLSVVATHNKLILTQVR